MEPRFRDGEVLLLAEPLPGAEPGFYILLREEGGMAHLCVAAEEPAPGQFCPTAQTIRLSLPQLARFVPTGVLLELAEPASPRQETA